MWSWLGEEAGEVPAELTALPHATARRSIGANHAIDFIGLMHAMLARPYDGTVTRGSYLSFFSNQWCAYGSALNRATSR